MKILFLGASGFLGSLLVPELRKNHEVVGTYANQPILGYEHLDLTDGREVRALVERDWDLIVHAAGFVDVASVQQERKFAWEINVQGTADVVRYAKSKILFISTDNVFDTAGPHDESSSVRPANAYGMFKFIAERDVLRASDQHLVLRVPFLYGPGQKFLSRFAGSQVKVPDPIICNPLYAPDIALRFDDLAQLSGIVHFGGATVLSRYDFYCLVVSMLDLDVEIVRIDNTAEEVHRPSNSVLISKKISYCGRSVPDGLEALKRELSQRPELLA